MNWLRFRASSAAPLLLGTDDLTETEKKRIKELYERHASFLTCEDPKEKKKLQLTDNMRNELDALLDKKKQLDNGVITLSAGAKTYIEKLVRQYVYKYKPSFGSRETDKGTEVEDEGIELINTFFFKDYQKSETHLIHGHWQGHPDIEDDEERMIIDNKSSWSKETFPVLPEDINNSTYEWQGKLYCYMKTKVTGVDWRRFRLVYTLISTPENLLTEFDNEDMHYMDDLDIKLRVTYKDFELTDDDIAHIERREAASVKYAQEYYSKLINKNN